MAKFEKLSFWYMLGMTLITLHLYPFAWVVDTTRRLRAAGGKVPSLFFYFAPFITTTILFITIYMLYFFDITKTINMGNNYSTYISLFKNFLLIIVVYFWLGYVRSYLQIIQHKKDIKSIVAYLILIVLFFEGKAALLISYVIDYFKNYFVFFVSLLNMSLQYPFIAVLVGYVITAILNNIVLFFLFQRGYNKLVE